MGVARAARGEGEGEAGGLVVEGGADRMVREGRGLEGIIDLWRWGLALGCKILGGKLHLGWLLELGDTQVLLYLEPDRYNVCPCVPKRTP